MKVAIIGSGVSGLCIGCYLQMNGFKTEIYEKQLSAGGLCTSWKRGAYTFESGFQWLLGSSPGSSFYQLWTELLDMNSIDFFQHKVRMEIEVKTSQDIHGSKRFHLYTNLQVLEDYMLQLAPEDEAAIRTLIKSMRRIQSFDIPPAIRKNPEVLSAVQKISFIRYLPLLFFLNRLKTETNFTFAARLKNPFLKEVFELLFDGEELPLMIITLPLAFNDLGATAYPIGGATSFVNRILAKYLELGGSIHFNTPVARIMTENGKTTGLELENGVTVLSDLTVSTADWHYTVFRALEGKFVNKRITELGELKKLLLFYSVFMVSMGVSRTFEGLPHFFRFPIPEELVSPDGTRYGRMECHIYNYDKTLAPEGKTVISVSFTTNSAAYWINLREKDREAYKRVKSGFAEAIITVLDQKLGGIREQIEIIDVATPATYHRYTGNRNGAAQGWMTGKNIVARTPVTCKLPGLKRFYYSGHWSQPGGGLPVAIKSARDTVQMICHDLKLRFKVTS